VNAAVIVAPDNSIAQVPSVVVHAMTAAEYKAQVQRIQQVMKAVMKDKVHYGIIPGCPKPSLWKPGAEVLCTTFHIAPSFIIVDLSNDRRSKYRVTCVAKHQPTGIVLGEGLGAANSNEEKYQWRDAVCEEEYDEADEDERRAKWQKGYNGAPAFKRLQIRTDPDNIDNTILKMACKRAQVAMTLNCTAASDIFTQDLEDMPEELRGAADSDEHAQQSRQQQSRGRPQTQAPQRRSTNGSGQSNGQSNGLCTDKQAKLIGVKLDNAGIPESEFLKQFNVTSISKLPFTKVNDALAWITNPEPEQEREPGLDDEG
jgi:hypothetical protein